MSTADVRAQIRALVEGIRPADPLEAEHRREALAWIDGPAELFRASPAGHPSPHLVSYFLLVDHVAGEVLLVDHRKAGLWLPTGGHVEPGEHPVATVHRELREELGIEAVFSCVTGERPAFVTITDTAPVVGRHTDVSLWFVLQGTVGQPLHPDTDEFHGVRWWTRAEIAAADRAGFDPHLGRMLAKFDTARRTAVVS